MNGQAWYRAGPSAGVGAVIVFVVAYFIGGTPPSPDDSTAAVASYLVDHQGAVLLAAFLLGLGSILYLWFLCHLRGVLAAAEGGYQTLSLLTVVGGTALMIALLIGDLPLAALAWRGPRGVDPSLVRLVYDASLLSLYSLSSAFAIASVAAPAIVIACTGVLPRWLALLGLVSVVVTAVEWFGILARSGWMAAGAGPGLFSVILWNLWVLAAAVTCLRSPVPSRAPAGGGA